MSRDLPPFPVITVEEGVNRTLAEFRTHTDNLASDPAPQAFEDVSILQERLLALIITDEAFTANKKLLNTAIEISGQAIAHAGKVATLPEGYTQAWKDNLIENGLSRRKQSLEILRDQGREAFILKSLESIESGLARREAKRTGNARV